MRDFKQSHDSRGGNRGGNRRFGNYRDEDRQMFQAVCANCGNTCQVPFRPSGDKPVYCNQCFADRDDGSNRRSFGHSDRPRGERVFRGGGDRPKSTPNFKRDLDEINRKLDILIQAVEAQKQNSSKTKKPKAVKPTKNPLPDTAIEAVIGEADMQENPSQE